MRRILASVAAAALLPAGAFADPLDLDLSRLGAPSANVWTYLGQGAGQEAQLASDARQRFALLSSEMGLAISSFVLSPASTTGYSGFDVALELGTMPVNATVIGTGPYARDYWPTRGLTPRQLYLPAVHVRKALPFSLELGGRVIYLDQSQMAAAQGEAKWSFLEGLAYSPDVAVRVAYTQLFGQRDWSLSATELDFMLGKRFGVGKVMSLTPYGAVRVTWIGASTDVIDFGVTAGGATPPRDLAAAQAAFPDLQMHSHHFLRYTVGVRALMYAASLGVEATYFGGSTFAAGDGYPAFTVQSSLAGAVKLGFEF